MKTLAVMDGGRYEAKVSGRLTTVEVLGRKEIFRGGRGGRAGRFVTKFKARNLTTGRVLSMGAARLRGPDAAWLADCKRQKEDLDARVERHSVVIEGRKIHGERWTIGSPVTGGTVAVHGFTVPGPEPEALPAFVTEREPVETVRDPMSCARCGLPVSSYEHCAGYDRHERCPEPSGTVRVLRNVEKHGVEVSFPVKPPADVRTDLTGLGFRWSPRNQVWWAREEPGMLDCVARMLSIYAERGTTPAVAVAS